MNILGTVSHFHETTEKDVEGNSIFPDKILPHYETGDTTNDKWDLMGIRLEYSYMSNYQFIKYSEVREKERKTENPTDR